MWIDATSALFLGRCVATKPHISRQRSTWRATRYRAAFRAGRHDHHSVVAGGCSPGGDGERGLGDRRGRIVLGGELLDRLGLVSEADRRGLRPIGPGGYTGGESYRAVVELQLAGGDFLSDRSLLADEATQRLRGEHSLASHTTLWRFCNGADLGRAQKAAAVNRALLRRAWAMGAAPDPGVLTIDPDATWVSTHGPGKEGSRLSRPLWELRWRSPA